MHDASTDAPHCLRVRTEDGDVWSVGLRWIYRPRLALDCARHLRAFLAGIAEAGAADWARELRAALVADGADPLGCVVEVSRREGRGERATWPVVARFVVRPAAPAGKGCAARGGRAA